MSSSRPETHFALTSASATAQFMSQLRTALGLAADATTQQILDRIAQLTGPQLGQ